MYKYLTMYFVVLLAINSIAISQKSQNLDEHQNAGDMSFKIREKFRTGNNSSGAGNFIDGFTSVLVGDLNGDGKQEIVMLGITNDYASGAIGTNGRYINVYNGKDGSRLIRYDLTELGDGYGNFIMGNTYHRAPSLLALADLDKDGADEIVVCQTDSNGYIYALKPIFNGAAITGMTKIWDGHGSNGAKVNFKAPLSIDGSGNNYTSDFGYPQPHIADLNGDGILEVIVYNKIFNGATGALLMSWQNSAPTEKYSSISSADGLSHTISDNPVSKANATNVMNKAMTGRRPGQHNYSDYALAVPAIVDIDGDGQQEIITGNRIHKFTFNSLDNHEKNSYTTIEGPLNVNLHTSLNNDATTAFYLSDGFTRVADIDDDGYPDIVVASFANDGGVNVNILIYVWDPRYPTIVKAANTFYSKGINGNFGIPFIGDINGKDDKWNGAVYQGKLPEICIVGGSMYINRVINDNGRSGIKFHPLSDEKLRQGAAESSGIAAGWDNNQMVNKKCRFNRVPQEGAGHIIALTYDAKAVDVEDRLKISWGMEHSDRSHNTGITLFDFDNNNIYDICYRDETSLRVVSPKTGNNRFGSDYVELNENENTPGTSVMFKTPVFCGTGFEYPTVADVDSDGNVDILVTQSATSQDADNTPGWINVYGIIR
jgi:hypothetical protein